ncbi:unnamed protein product [Somion occarium]|uniref:TPR-like protein n=1 Tax=Somion occarium TaxID=3059160 RepID=A0ABP1DIY2_9APHY
MSLQGLISGSECAVPFNPLSQVLKHTEGDRSLQQDRVAGSSSSRLQHLPSTATAPSSERDLALARQFFDAQTQGPGTLVPYSIPQQPLQDIGASLTNSGRATPDLNTLWAKSQQHQFSHDQTSRAQSSHPASATGWAQEFGGASFAVPSAQANAAQRSEFNQASYMSPRMYGGMPMNMYSGMYGNAPPSLQMDVSKGKGKAREIDFEAAFAQVTQSLSNIEDQSRASEQESARISEFDDTADLSEAMQNASMQDLDSVGAPLGSDFKTVWNHLQNSDLPPPAEDLAKWEAEYNQLMSSHREELDTDYGADMQAAWEGGLGQYDGAEMDEQVKFDKDGLPLLGEYVFEANNKYLDPSSSTRSPLEEAKSLIDHNGSLTEAALLLEAAIQQGELGKGGYEAWILLGEVRGMDEREEAGMRALTEGVKLAEAAGAAGEGMLSLAISYTNESYDRAAHTMLLRWLAARYPSFTIPEETWRSLSESSWHSHELVTEAFLSLAREQHQQGIMDPDVQTGLGVISYANGQYDRAKDCFEAALSVRPEDFILWNRLGSSLSNGNHPEEALGAYREALQRRPTYTRAIYNVGVACLNIGAHKEAAEHFLSALAMQDSSAGPKSEQLWSTLRRTFQTMNRSDVAEMATSGANVDDFRKEGFDF